MGIQSYQDLAVWQKSIELVTNIYKTTRGFPKEEVFALTSQIRRAAVSIPANIAEGWGRNMTKEYAQYLRIARGSLLELETHLTISNKLDYLSSQSFDQLLGVTQEINKMLNSIINKLNSSL